MTATETLPPVRLMQSLTVHQREVPFVRRFQYRMLFLDLDIDTVNQARGAARLFAINRPGVFSWRARDHGARSNNLSLRCWAERAFSDAGLDVDASCLRLICLPRVFGYAFRPISVWLASSAGGQPSGVIYEVNNTFGETHSYVASIDADRVRHESQKSFHVSPFFDVSGQYRFTLSQTGQGLKLMVETYEGAQRTHIATLACKEKALSDSALLKSLLGMPFMSHGVTAAIHWEALWLWLRGAGYRDKPQPPDAGFSVAVKRAATDGQEARLD